MQLSIVTTLYNSARCLEEFHRRVSETAAKVAQEFEIILVNDGSPDSSLEVSLKLQASDNRTKVVDLSRNFGHHHAIMAGLSYASGELVFLIDCDLEEPPELLERFHSQCQAESDLDALYGVQAARKGGAIERIGGALFYRLFRLLSRVDLPDSPLTIRLMRRRFVDALLRHHESELFLAGIFSVTGFRQRALVVNKGSRAGTAYTFRKRVHLMATAITSFSAAPLVFSFYVGALIAGVALSAGVYLAIRRIVLAEQILTGWTSVMVSVWFMGGVILLSTGVLGLYLSRIYNEVKRRPNFIVRKLYGQLRSGPE